MQRDCRYVPLSKQPLALVLCQIRFTPVRKIADYIPAIQEEFRRHKYPIEHSGKIQQLTIGQNGIINAKEQERWEYLTKNEDWSIIIFQDSVVLQTTAYQRFEEFAKQLRLAVGTTLTKTEHDNLGLIQRIGLRYINLIQPHEDKDFRYYLRSGFHGLPDGVFQGQTHRLRIETIGQTSVGDTDGIMVIRVSQSDQGNDLPADLLPNAPKHRKQVINGKLITFLDIDHYIEGNFEPEIDWIEDSIYKLHDNIVETLHDYVITREAVEEWK